jgi:hypothetical protein
MISLGPRFHSPVSLSEDFVSFYFISITGNLSVSCVLYTPQRVKVEDADRAGVDVRAPGNGY